eukprot:CAMPEP_0179118762 /NCGR_PEP_ID=MMETSP0796-20121207/55872_1 /TAXON_ID=73915 /ORGANISM="Pyrodinium bahamense, Strain pbaha01" /LENGTH=147 /DNA_ID=CAMNT_0020817233 /DNA_START=46 /DNA_END=486 /DNA_ORIENTATION=+
MTQPWLALLLVAVLRGGGRDLGTALASEEDLSLHELQEELREREADEEGSLTIGEDDDEHPVLLHSKGRECITQAEQVERDIGLFDDKHMGKSTMRRMAEKLKEHASAILGQSTDDFVDKFQGKLLEVQEGSGAFGAADACHFLLQH